MGAAGPVAGDRGHAPRPAGVHGPRGDRASQRGAGAAGAERVDRRGGPGPGAGHPARAAPPPGGIAAPGSLPGSAALPPPSGGPTGSGRIGSLPAGAAGPWDGRDGRLCVADPSGARVPRQPRAGLEPGRPVCRPRRARPVHGGRGRERPGPGRFLPAGPHRHDAGRLRRDRVGTVGAILGTMRRRSS